MNKKIILFYVCDVMLILISLVSIFLYDNYLYEYLDFGLDYFFVIMIIAAVAVGIGATFSFVIQKATKKEISFNTSFVYTFRVLAVLSGVISFLFFVNAYFLSSSWASMGYFVFGLIGLYIFGFSLLFLFGFFVIRKIKDKRKSR